MVVVDTARLFPVDESIVQQKCYTTKPRLDWGTWERIEAISASLKELVSITTQVVSTADEYLLVNFYDPLDGQLYYSAANLSVKCLNSV